MLAVQVVDYVDTPRYTVINCSVEVFITKDDGKRFTASSELYTREGTGDVII